MPKSKLAPEPITPHIPTGRTCQGWTHGLLWRLQVPAEGNTLSANEDRDVAMFLDFHCSYIP